MTSQVLSREHILLIQTILTLYITLKLTLLQQIIIY